MHNSSYYSDDSQNKGSYHHSPDKNFSGVKDQLTSRYSNGYQNIKVIFNDEEGNIYEGEMQNNRKHGFGKQLFTNGSLYEGKWKDGFMDGFGKLVLSTGETYLGDFYRGKRHGKGKLIFAATGDVYEGDWC